MSISSKKITSKDFRKPDERREFKSHGHLDVLKFDDGSTVGRGVFEPGWRWSNDIRPIVDTKSCEAEHMGYCLKGKMTIRMDSGEEIQLKAGEAFHIPAGHDAWVDGAEVCELLDFSGFAAYAISKGQIKKSA